jgi:diacylglycerol kinase family enzyme
MVGKFEVEPTNVDDNARRLAKVLTTGDLVIAAGGDGTANIAVNGIMLSKAQNVKFGVIGYGNFNDVARTFGNLKLDDILRGHVKRVYPLECKINGKHWRFGMCYFTLGMFAEACACFDAPKTRKTLRKGGRKTIYSLMTLVGWWFKNHRRKFLPESFHIGDSSEDFAECKKVSDYMAVNGKTVAKMMHGGKYYLSKDGFLSYNGQMTKFFKLCFMMAKSILRRIPGTESDYDCLVFPKPSKMMVQAEGEYHKFEDVEIIEISKADKPLLAIVK